VEGSTAIARIDVLLQAVLISESIATIVAKAFLVAAG